MSKYPHYLESLQNATRKYWNKTALHTLGGDSFTYGQMAVQVEKFHLAFEALGFKKGDKIALYAANGARWGMAYMAVNTYETVIVPLLADFTPANAAFLVDHSEALAIFTNRVKWENMPLDKMPKLRIAIDVDTWECLWAKDAKTEKAYAKMESLFEEKWKGNFGPEDVVYPTDNMYDLSTII